jgi:tRNA (guanine-N7-)-methyltransferase
MTAMKPRASNPYKEVPTLPETSRIDLREVLGGWTGPVEIEIGFGKGRFLLDRAEALPKTRFLGLETRRKWVHLVRSRQAKRRLDNVVVLHGDARSGLSRLFPDASVQRIFINFPDPWWKARHEKRMVICPALLTESARLLVDGGDIFVQTDVDFRKDAYKVMLAGTPDLLPHSGDGETDANPFRARSLRENRCIETALPVYRLWFCKKRSASAEAAR